MTLQDTTLQQLKQLRRELHARPEISGQEKETAATIKRFIMQYEPDEVLTGVGGTGMMFIFDSGITGPTVMVRSELDALPIEEHNDDIPHRSTFPGKGHLCGHDGHMVMVAGIAAILSEKRPARGKVVLLFQPAEETGEGARWMLNDPQFSPVNIDYAFALHNLPGFETNEIVIKEDVFASASKGLIISLEGKTSHAAEPENGNSPVRAVAKIIEMIEGACESISSKDFTLATIVHVKVGDRAFGTTPGKAEVMTTIRAYRNEDLELLENYILNHAADIATQHQLEIQSSETEVFSSSTNDKECCKHIIAAAEHLGLELKNVSSPFRWSEDFGLFTQEFKGAIFGLGSGLNTPDLHNPNYDFPDEIIKTGTLMFYYTITQLLEAHNV